MNMLTELDLICSILLKCSACASLLTLSWAAFRYGKTGQPAVTLQAPVTTTLTTGTATATAIDYIVPSQPWPHGDEVTPADPAVKKVEAPPAEAPVEPIECGNCHKDILSQPVTRMQVDGNTWDVYACEHCGIQVKLPVV